MPYTKHNYQKGDELLASQLNDMDDQIALNEQTADTLVTVSNTQPLEEKNRVWVKTTPSEIEIPTMEDIDELNRQLNDETTGLDSKAPVILETASGAIASFDDGADSMPIRKIVATIEPVQAAGTPSPENPLPISGWTGAILGNTVPAPESGITFPFEPKQAGAGDPSPTNIRPISGYDLTLEDETHVTVYCGAVTLNQDGSADVVSELGARVLNGSETWSPNTSYPGNAFFTSAHGMKRATNYKNVILCDKVKVCAGFTFQDFYDATEGITGFHRSDYSGKNWLYIRVNGVTTATGIKEWLANNPLQVCYQLATPQIYHFSNVGQLKTFLGEIGYTAQLLPVNWQSEAGTVYGGTVTLNADGSADVVSNRRKNILNGSEEWSLVNGGFYYDRLPISGYGLLSQDDWICNKYLVSAAITNFSQVDSKPDKRIFNQNSGTGLPPINLRRVWVKDSAYSSEAEFKAALSADPIEIVCTLPEPETYHFDNIGQLKTFLGTNNVWCDTGDIEVTYPADTKLFLTARDEEITGNIAPIENGTTASKAYAQGAYFWHDTKFCKALTAIASGATFTLGTNYQETTVAAELLAAQN